jgi:enamine deaminase RidA (YjgF/YER057c/UK114 family)
VKRAIAMLAVGVALAAAPAAGRADAPESVTFTGAPNAPISAGVALPTGTSGFWVSGTPPSAPYGDTKEQTESALHRVEAVLKPQGLTLRDVTYLRVYLVSDKKKGAVDFKGFFDGYGEAFGTAANPTKPARSTLAVAGLVQPEWLVVVEAFAVYPKK